MSDEQDSPTPATQLVIKDRRGVITTAAMRVHFEGMCRDTPCLHPQPMDATVIDSTFHCYQNEETNMLWLGFALGMRCAERAAKRTSKS